MGAPASHPMPVQALQHAARMRGGAQAQLLLASDGHYYIVKFQNNPQHRRVLANELLASFLLRHLELPTPAAEVVDVPAGLLAVSPNLYIETGGRRCPCATGKQFGSRYPGDPSRVPVYDYIPDSLLRQVLNADCFLGMVAFDKWVANADGRQAIFLRDHVARWRPALSGTNRSQQGMVAVMVDHGFAFTAHHWSFRDTPQTGLYPRPWLYDGVTGYESFEPWLSRIREFTPEVLDDAFKHIPPEWFEGDFPALEQLLETLYQRRRRVPELLRVAKQGPRDPFPHWP
jgi:hypothetical protein